ncbi:MAG: hypothetical protein BGO96_04140 [Micrococcales bacterium 73-15]|uniref:hypothetical protein n=1 Tax=Salana multivorans TaxID=120377 RepID=UPI000969762E|nr:hypothetical protein [Salana multivorans]OJX98371.1 MAG: hypothetical protein BGO96_04140 [Micrococcales bacterium 73-15]
MRGRLVLGGPRAARLPLALLALVVAIVSLAGPLALALARGADDAGAAGVLADLPTPDRGLAIATRTADDPAEQLAGADDVLAALPGAPALHVITQRLTYPLASAEQLPGGRDSVVLMATDDLADAVRIVAGTLPSSADGAARLEVVAPAPSGLAIGDVLTLGERATRVVVVGLWETTDDDAAWFGDPGVAAGEVTDVTTGGGSAIGPLLVADPADLLPTVERARQRWILLPAPDLRGEDVPRVAQALAAAPDRLAGAGVFTQGSAVSGGGPATFAALAARAADVGARGQSAAALVVVAGAVGVLAVGAALGRALLARTRLLLARGAGQLQVGAVDAPGVVAAAGLGAGVGLGCGVALGAILAAVGAGGGGVGAGDAARWALGAFLAAGLGTWALTRRRLAVDRFRPGLGWLVGWTILAVGTAWALWRLLTGGLLVGTGTGVRADLAAAFALPLLLPVAGVAATSLLRPVARAATRLARRGLGPLLTLRRLAHGPHPTLGAAAAVTGGAALLATRAAAADDQLGRPLALALLCAAVASAALATAVGIAAAGERHRRGLAGATASGVPPRTGRLGSTASDVVTAAVAIAVGAAVAAALAPELLGTPTVGGGS